MQIPRIIHQIWSGVEEPLPKQFEILGDTWKENHYSWRYIFWDNDKIELFIQKNYPQFMDTYVSFQYNIQRWDAIRYLILYKIGGLYVDFDYECFRSHEPLLKNKTCCFALESGDNKKELNGKRYTLTNALMASVPNHSFMEKIINFVFSYNRKNREMCNFKKEIEVLITTGPIALNHLYEKYKKKESVYLIPSKYVSPFTSNESRQVILGNRMDEEIEKKLQQAYSVHYYFSNWMITKN